MTPPTEDEIQQAIEALVQLDHLDLTGRQLTPDASAAPAALLERAGPAALAPLEAALPRASGTGRIALAIAILTVDRSQGQRVAATLIDDTSPAVVNTCLVGYRTVAQWARTVAPPPPPAASPALPARSARLPWLIVALIVALALLRLALMSR